MGGAVCLRRRWAIASDDWIFLAPLIVFIHAAFAILVYPDLMPAVYATIAVICFDISLAIWSCAGTVFDVEMKRRYLPTFLGIRLFVNSLEMVGCMLAAHASPTIRAFITSLVGLVLTSLVTLSLPALSSALETHSLRSSRASATARVVPWGVRAFLRCFGARTEHLSTMGELLLKFNEYDMTVSDILTGLLLVPKPPPPLGTPVLPDDPALRFITQYATYASLIYGWPIDAMIKFTSANTTLPAISTCMRSLCCLFPLQASHPDIVGDNCCHWNAACVEQWIAARRQSHGECTLIRASFHTSVSSRNIARSGVPPWLIMDDHALHTTVIAIRGTLSVQDAITDSMVHLVPLAGGEVHEGFFHSARKLLDELTDDIEQATYPLVLVGHSMGGAIATICGLMLRERGLRDLQVLTLSAPGATISPSLYEVTSEFVTTLMVHEDWSPRVSLSNIWALQKEIDERLSLTRHSKVGIVLKRLLQGCDALEMNGHYVAGDTHALDTITPGRVMHLRPNRFSIMCCGLYSRQTEFTPFWIDPLDLTAIVVAAKAMEFHSLHITIDAVDSLLSSLGVLSVIVLFPRGRSQSNGIPLPQHYDRRCGLYVLSDGRAEKFARHVRNGASWATRLA
eukprot:GEMP01024782.1.p1 GENE.GEMP01024782.1~~GEMP01024782.1.p1  ORF type:complete len:625 (+),score=115.70 GEMP01024782.1:193-2067(+)